MEDYPSIFDSHFNCFSPPKPLSKSSIKDFEQWFEDFNGYEVVRYMFISCLTDMIYVLFFTGDDGFSDEEIDAYLFEFGSDKRLNDRKYLKSQIAPIFNEWKEYRTVAELFREIIVFEEEDFEY